VRAYGFSIPKADRMVGAPGWPRKISDGAKVSVSLKRIEWLEPTTLSGSERVGKAVKPDRDGPVGRPAAVLIG
jgi:hypothetical protein